MNLPRAQKLAAKLFDEFEDKEWVSYRADVREKFIRRMAVLLRGWRKVKK